MHVSTIFLNFTIGLVVRVSNLGFYRQLVFLNQEKNDKDAEFAKTPNQCISMDYFQSVDAGQSST